MEKLNLEFIKKLVCEQIELAHKEIQWANEALKEVTEMHRESVAEKQKNITALERELHILENMDNEKPEKKVNDLKIIPTHFPTTKRKAPNKLSQDGVNQVLQNLHKKNADLARMVNVTASVITHIRRGTHPLVKTSPYKVQQFN